MPKKTLKKMTRRRAAPKRKDVPLIVTAQLNHKLDPLQRGERYEESLQDELQKQRFGQVVGGGTMTEKSGEIEFFRLHGRLSIV